jgi:hypothetical protein
MSMKSTVAWHCLLLAVIFGAVLFLPLSNPAAAGARAPGCPHCQMTGQGLGTSPCCPHSAQPGKCGTCGQTGALTCYCSAGSPVFITACSASPCSWQVFPYVPAKDTVAMKLFPLLIFHPPQLPALPLQI